MRNIVKAARALAIAPLLVLAGCGGEPSEGDMRAALEKQFDKANKAAAEQGFTGFKAALEKFEKGSCDKQDGSAVYRCTVTVKYSGPMMNVDGATTEMRFTKGDDGWVVVQ